MDRIGVSDIIQNICEIFVYKILQGAATRGYEACAAPGWKDLAMLEGHILQITILSENYDWVFMIWGNFKVSTR